MEKPRYRRIPRLFLFPRYLGWAYFLVTSSPSAKAFEPHARQRR